MTQSAIEKKHTFADYLKTPDDKRYELIEGDLIMTPSPIPQHQRILGRLYLELSKWATEKDQGEAFMAPLDVHLDDYNVFEPDILFISKERSHIIGEKNIQGAPDLAVEIISESSAYRDMVQKKKLYAGFGVKEYWIVTPEEGSISVYAPGENSVHQLHKIFVGADVLDSPLLKDLRLPLKNIF